MKKLYIQPEAICEDVILEEMMQIPSQDEWADTKERGNFEEEEENMEESGESSSNYSLW